MKRQKDAQNRKCSSVFQTLDNFILCVCVCVWQTRWAFHQRKRERHITNNGLIGWEKRRERSPWDIACTHACHHTHIHYGLVWRRNDFNESRRKLIQKKTKQTISTQQNCFLFYFVGGLPNGNKLSNHGKQKKFFFSLSLLLSLVFLHFVALLFVHFHTRSTAPEQIKFTTARTHRSPIAK